GFSNGDHILVKGKEYVISNVDSSAGAQTFEIKPALTGTNKWDPGTDVKRFRQANETGGSAAKTINVWGAASLYAGAIVELSNDEKKETAIVDKVEGSLVTLSKTLNEAYFEGDKLRVIEAEVTVLYVP